jgi:hypothetical protein
MRSCVRVHRKDDGAVASRHAQSPGRLRQWAITKLRVWTKPYPQLLNIGTLTDLGRSKHQLMLENALLRQQLIVVSRQVKRPKLTWHDRALVMVLVSRLKTW